MQPRNFSRPEASLSNQPKFNQKAFKATLLSIAAAAALNACKAPSETPQILQNPNTVIHETTQLNRPLQVEQSRTQTVRRIGEAYLDRLTVLGLTKTHAPAQLREAAIKQAVATVKHLEQNGGEVSYEAFRSLQAAPALGQTLSQIEKDVLDVDSLPRHTLEFFGNTDRGQALDYVATLTQADKDKGWRPDLQTPDLDLEPLANGEDYAKYFEDAPALQAPRILAPGEGVSPLEEEASSEEPTREVAPGTNEVASSDTRNFPWKTLAASGLLAGLGVLAFKERRRLQNLTQTTTAKFKNPFTRVRTAAARYAPNFTKLSTSLKSMLSNFSFLNLKGQAVKNKPQNKSEAAQKVEQKEIERERLRLEALQAIDALDARQLYLYGRCTGRGKLTKESFRQDYEGFLDSEPTVAEMVDYVVLLNSLAADIFTNPKVKAQQQLWDEKGEGVLAQIALEEGREAVVRRKQGRLQAESLDDLNTPPNYTQILTQTQQPQPAQNPEVDASQTEVEETSEAQTQAAQSEQLQTQIDAKTEETETAAAQTNPPQTESDRPAEHQTKLDNLRASKPAEVGETPETQHASLDSTNPWEGELVIIGQTADGEGKAYQVPTQFADKLPTPEQVQESRRWLIENPLVPRIDLYKGKEVIPNNGDLKTKEFRQMLAEAEKIYRGDLGADFEQLLSDLILGEIAYIPQPELEVLITALQEYKYLIKETRDTKKDYAKKGIELTWSQILSNTAPEITRLKALRKKAISILDNNLTYLPNSKKYLMVGDVVRDGKSHFLGQNELWDDGLTLRVIQGIRRQARSVLADNPIIVTASNHDYVDLIDHKNIKILFKSKKDGEVVEEQLDVFKFDYKSSHLPKALEQSQLEALYAEYMLENCLLHYDEKSSTFMSHSLLSNDTKSPTGHYINKLQSQLLSKQATSPAELTKFVAKANEWFKNHVREILKVRQQGGFDTGHNLDTLLVFGLVESRDISNSLSEVMFSNIVDNYVVGHHPSYGVAAEEDLLDQKYDSRTQKTLVNLEKNHNGLYIPE